MSYKLSTSITIHASPKDVWNVLLDFEAYPEWNPFINAIKGKVLKGEKILVEINGMKFKPEILSCKAENELIWLGNFFFKGLFDGLHFFVLIENPDGSTTLNHGEQFTGILVGLMKRKLETEILNGFQLMNQKLKERVEAKILKKNPPL